LSFGAFYATSPAEYNVCVTPVECTKGGRVFVDAGRAAHLRAGYPGRCHDSGGNIFRKQPATLNSQERLGTMSEKRLGGVAGQG
jgi:hypothetical protein